MWSWDLAADSFSQEAVEDARGKVRANGQGGRREDHGGNPGDEGRPQP